MGSFSFLYFFEEGSKPIVCVTFDKKISKYIAAFTHEQKRYYCGCFSNELEAAQAVNWKCLELDIPVKNLPVGFGNQPQVSFVKNFKTQCMKLKLLPQNLMFCLSVFSKKIQNTSKFTGVCFDKKLSKYWAKI
jgi:hypothetical protein